MNIANRLTLLRIVLIPVYIIFLLLEISHFHFLIAAVVFIVASLTDMLDGRLARKYNLVSDFGKFADPLADKLLVLSAMICFVQLGMMPAWICIVITAREIAINGLRLISADKGKVIAASKLGKFKTVTQMAFIILSTINFSHYLGANAPGFCQVIEVIRVIIMYLALVMTVVSFIDYVYKNRDVFTFREM
ncbi:MAG: CDP-diacylglycerol--glycerol-3-phosphate 3-phosphatidyltransferase [Parasporobacterium sp.]|nr:CDP-diacylglycerol--glycerol-3-phosphate 3-phosphatidyltransferase [Parasporobacterium sp.]